MNYSPAEIVRALLVQQGLTVSPAEGVEWPTYVSAMPDIAAIHDNAVCVYDTGGLVDGRLMRSGETIEHPGFQVRIRARTHTEGYSKAFDILRAFDALLRWSVNVEEKAYLVHSIGRRGNILALGVEVDGLRKRFLFTINAFMTFKEI